MSGQTLVDLALQYLGDASRAFELAQLNAISVTDDLEPGTTIMLPVPDSNKMSLVRMFNVPSLAPASADTINGMPQKESGIDYDTIEIDLVVT